MSAASAAFLEGVSGSTVSVAAVLAKLPAELTAAHKHIQLGACLQAFASPEALCGDNAYVCEACDRRREAAGEAVGEAAGEAAGKAAGEAAGGAAGKAVGKGEPALKWLQLSQVPSVLTLHLKRFRSTGRRVNKLDEHVPFPAVLDLSPFTCAPGKSATHYEQLGEIMAGTSQASSSMRLYGVVEHVGTFSGGHYIAYVKLEGRWYRMSDSVVREVSEAEVLGKQAFMLFYEREG